MPLRAIPCVLMRGGTSKGPYFQLSDLPDEPAVVVARLGMQVGSATSPGEALTDVARVVATTLGADAVVLRVADGREFGHGDGARATRSLGLVHHGRNVGSLCLTDPAGGLGRGQPGLPGVARPGGPDGRAPRRSPERDQRCVHTLTRV